MNVQLDISQFSYGPSSSISLRGLHWKKRPLVLSSDAIGSLHGSIGLVNCRFKYLFNSAWVLHARYASGTANSNLEIKTFCYYYAEHPFNQNDHRFLHS